MADFLETKAKCTHITEVLEEQTPVGQELYPFTGYVDFRELLLMPENATAMGALGNTTYGDVFRSLSVPLNEELLATDPNTGVSNVNQLLRPLTGLMSGEEGTLIYEGNVFSFTFPADIGKLIANISAGVGDLRIDNLDTIGDPLSLLMPMFMRPFDLDNKFGIGLGGRPLRFSMRLSINILLIDDETRGKPLNTLWTCPTLFLAVINDVYFSIQKSPVTLQTI